MAAWRYLPRDRGLVLIEAEVAYRGQGLTGVGYVIGDQDILVGGSKS